MGRMQSRSGRDLSIHVAGAKRKLRMKPSESTDAVVFVVDDDASMREAISSLIRSVGLRVEMFSSANDFLQMKKPDTPRCLVLDVRLTTHCHRCDQNANGYRPCQR